MTKEEIRKQFLTKIDVSRELAKLMNDALKGTGKCVGVKPNLTVIMYNDPEDPDFDGMGWDQIR